MLEKCGDGLIIGRVKRIARANDLDSRHEPIGEQRNEATRRFLRLPFVRHVAVN
jgi:hypothetical protein